jgi:putative Holliday junction resolvase
MKYLGIDFGTKQIGLAISVPGETMAFPLPAIVNDQYIFKKIKNIGEERGIAGIVIGLPVSATETNNVFLENVQHFARVLKEHVSWPIFFEKENYSSRHAALVANQKESLDSASAVIILDRFLAKKIEGEN